MNHHDKVEMDVLKALQEDQCKTISTLSEETGWDTKFTGRVVLSLVDKQEVKLLPTGATVFITARGKRRLKRFVPPGNKPPKDTGELK